MLIFSLAPFTLPDGRMGKCPGGHHRTGRDTRRLHETPTAHLAIVSHRIGLQKAGTNRGRAGAFRTPPRHGHARTARAPCVSGSLPSERWHCEDLRPLSQERGACASLPEADDRQHVNATQWRRSSHEWQAADSTQTISRVGRRLIAGMFVYVRQSHNFV